jgi:hypothetical protein
MQSPSMATNIPASNVSEEVDVLRIDAANLQDVLQYTGFDLRTETESMQSHIYHMPTETRHKEEDIRSLPQYFFNANRLRTVFSFYCRQFNVPEVDERCMEIMGLALQNRIRDVLELLVRISRHRVDYGRRLYKIKIENDPKKQFWLLERLRTNPPWTQELESEEKQEESSRPDQHPLISNASSSTHPSSVGGKTAKKKLPKKEEQSIKTKITNVTAMAAAGMKQRSWMTSASIAPSSLSVEDQEVSEAQQEGEEGEEGIEPGKPRPPPINLANAPSSIPLTDQDLASELRTRTINRRDFLAACKMDPRLRRSRLHIQLLDLAPLLSADKTK